MRMLNAWQGRGIAVLAGGLLAAGCAGGMTEPRLSGAAAAAAPMSVACEPGQRAIVHPAAIDGVMGSQVECRTTDTIAAPGAQPAAVPSAAAFRDDAPMTVAQPAGASVYARPAVYERPAAEPVAARVQQPDVVRTARVERRPVRTVKKSAIIIGSSAGAGAGLGAAIGGKKGALIGAIVGGGGATLWDQITRRSGRR